MDQCSSDHLLVAAIDIGTTFSGYAFSFRHQYDKDPTQVCANSWTAGTAALMSHKTPTCALFKPNGTFETFGYEAEDKYSNLALDGEHRDWYYFKRFKMKLYQENHLKRGLILEEENGKTKPALEVISHSIGYLKNHLMKTCKNQQSDLEPSDILWVLTVPAIWSDPAKQFMREAAEKADIPHQQLKIALEPEAASLFCMRLPVEKFGCGMQKGFSAFSVGSKYIVVDAGGGTIDITVHEVQPGGTLKELYKANGGAWGGTKVDEAFRALLAGIVGNDVMDVFCTEHKSDMLDLYRDFEVKKRTITPNSTDKITFKVPIQLSETYKILNSEEEIKDCLATIPKYKGKLSWIGDKIRMDAELAKGLYDDSIRETVGHLQKLFSHREVKECCSILMVGGFSESPMLQEAIKKNFKNLRVIVPNETGLSVLKGAVVYGHNPSTIKYRVCKYTYGISTNGKFNPAKHDINKKFIDGDGEECCRDVFDKHVEIGQTVTVGEPQVKTKYLVIQPDQTAITLPIYISTEKNPLYATDEPCKLLGKVTVNMPNTELGMGRSTTTSMTFSGTELEVNAVNDQDGKLTVASFDLLE